MFLKRILLIFSFVCISYQIGYTNSFLRLYEPAFNAVVDNSNIKFNWNVSPYGGNYQLQLSSTSDFSSIFKDTIVTSNQFQSTIAYFGNVFWKVRIVGSNFKTNWSNVSTFTTFNPVNDASLLLWLDGNNTELSGANVSSWKDKSINANDAIQLDINKQPLLVSSSPLLNNNSYIKLDGVDDFLKINRITNGRTFILLYKHATGSQDYAGVLGDISSLNFTCDAGTNFLILQGTPVSGGSIFVNKILKPNLQIKKPTQFSLMSFITNADEPIDHIASDRYNGGRYWNGEYVSLLVFSSALSDENRKLVEDYLLYKYAPPILIKDTVVSAKFCDSTNIIAPSFYQNFLWSNGSSLSNTKFISNGNNFINTTDIFGQTSQSEFSIYPYRHFDNSTVFICNGQTFVVSMNLPSGFIVNWQHNSSNNLTQTFTQSGQYTVKVTDNVGCFVFDTINVIVDNPKLNPIVTGGNISLCKNEKLFLNTITAFDSILWSTGSTDNFIPISTAGSYSIYARTTTGCVLNQNFNVTIAGNAPVAAFANTALCQNNVTQFNDSSTITPGANISGWKWDFSNGNTSILQNPTNIFGTTGVFSAALKVTTNQGCTDSVFKTFVVNKRPIASFSNRRSCEGNPTLFEDLSTPNSTNIISRNWNFANLGIINDVQTPAFVFPSANTYNVKLIVTNSNGCVDSITNAVKVNQSPISDFSFDAVCGRSPVNFRFLATVPTSPTPPQPTIATWQWDFGDNTFNAAIKDVSHVYNSTGTYPVKLTVTSSDQCPNTIEKEVKVYEFPIVDFDISPTQCAGKDIQFTDRSQTPDGTPITSWKWYFSGQSTDTMKNTSYAFATEGNYTIQLTAANAVGCAGTKLRSVAVSSLPVPKFTFSPQNGLPPLIVNYNNQSPITGNYVWNYGDGSPEIQGFNPPTHIYNTKGTYPISLTATNFLGCTDVLTKFILVDKAFIDGVMTSITIIPNGDYYQIQATILNASNIEIRDLGLTLQLGGGAIIKEDWTGSLMPGQTTIYNFIGQIKISDNSIPVICTSIDNVNNNSPEDKTDNNSTCKEVRVGAFDVLNVYPNPAIESINFGVMLPRDGKVTIGFVDVLGQTMFKKEFDGVRGYNNLSLSTVELNAAIYVAVITFDGETIYEKFMRKDRK